MNYYDEPSVNVTTKPALGLGTIGILTGIVLCILKACGVIAISWFWATFPFWIVPAVEIAIILIFGLIALLVVLFTGDK